MKKKIVYIGFEWYIHATSSNLDPLVNIEWRVFNSDNSDKT